MLNLAVLRAQALPSGLVTLAATQVGYGGLLFTFTLYLQAGLGQRALRAGASYLPMAVVFGLTGYHWRRLPAAARRVVVPAGLAVGVAAYLALAAGLHAASLRPASLHWAGRAGGLGALTWIGLAGVGLGLGLSVSPLLTQSLTHVPAARAADASGLLTTTVQLCPAARRGRRRLGLPVPRDRPGRRDRIGRRDQGSRLGPRDVRHGLLAGGPVRRRPAHGGGHDPGRTAHHRPRDTLTSR